MMTEQEWTDYCGGSGRVLASVVDEDGKVLIGRALARCPGCSACFWFDYLKGVVEDSAREADREIIGAYVGEPVAEPAPVSVQFEFADGPVDYKRSLVEEVYGELRLMTVARKAEKG